MMVVTRAGKRVARTVVTMAHMRAAKRAESMAVSVNTKKCGKFITT